MNELIRAAAELQAFCEAQLWRHCFIGGLALQRWGEPRETVDVDLTLVTGFGEQDFIDLLLAQYGARIPLKPIQSSPLGAWDYLGGVAGAATDEEAGTGGRPTVPRKRKASSARKIATAPMARKTGERRNLLKIPAIRPARRA